VATIRPDVVVASANLVYLLAVPLDSSRREAMMGAGHDDSRPDGGEAGKPQMTNSTSHQVMRDAADGRPSRPDGNRISSVDSR